MKITLETAARYICESGCKSQTEYEARLAALLRAAQKVVDAARELRWNDHAQWCPVQYEPTQTCTCGLHACLDALNEFRKLEEGE